MMFAVFAFESTVYDDRRTPEGRMFVLLREEGFSLPERPAKLFTIINNRRIIILSEVLQILFGTGKQKRRVEP